MKIGIDIGGVIIDRANDDEDTSLFGDNYLNARPVAGAIEALQKLNTEIFPKEVFIVSKCGEKIEARSREWLKAKGVYEKTGIPESNVHFCRQRADKAPIARKLGLTHFVDDRLEVLGYMRGIVEQRILFAPSPQGLERYGLMSGPVILTFSWKDVIEFVTGPGERKQPTADKLKDFFILRQEFDWARAVVDLEKIRGGTLAEADEAFAHAHEAWEQLTSEQRFEKANDLKHLIDAAKETVERA
jgi:hypothetical protein